MNDDSAAGYQPGSDDSRSDSREAFRLRERVSALMDGELPPGSHGEAWAELAREPEARAAWLRYHQVGDWLRSAELHGAFDEAAFLRRFSERLRDEPVQFAPSAMHGAGGPAWRRAAPWAGALGVALAGLATVALLGGMLPQRSEPWSEPEATQASIGQGAAWVPGLGSAGDATNALRIGLRANSVALNTRLALGARPTCMPDARARDPARLRAMP